MSTEKKRQYDREYYQKNRAKKLAQGADYYATHRDQVLNRVSQYHTLHPEKLRERGRRWAENNKEKIKAKDFKRRNSNPADFQSYMRKWHLKFAYGLTDAQYQEILLAQGGVCAICGGDNNGKFLEVDHSHSTGIVRGLLCRSCNTAIGFLNDNPDIADSLSAYLRRNK